MTNFRRVLQRERRKKSKNGPLNNHEEIWQNEGNFSRSPCNPRIDFVPKKNCFQQRPLPSDNSTF